MSKELTAILGAFNEEIEAYKDHLENYSHALWHDYEFWFGTLFGKDVVVTKSGVGKVHAAMVTQRIIDEYRPSALIFTGLAGSLHDHLEIGDVVVSRDLLQHDFVAHPQFPKYTIPRFNRQDTFHIFKADTELTKKAMTYQPHNHRIVEGRILTGDQFLTRSELVAYTYLIEELKGDAVEMEGAAVAQVCTVNQVPFVVIRTISDKANESAPLDFDTFLPRAAQNSLKVVKHIFSPK